MNRRATFVCLAIALLVGLTGFGLLTHLAAAGGNSKKNSHQRIAVIDLSRIFKESREFQAACGKLKADTLKTGANMKRELEKAKTQLEEAQKLPLGSDERITQEEQATRLKAAITAELGVQQQAVRREEAKMYNKTFAEISKLVEEYAASHDLELVLSCPHNQVNPSKAEEVAREINKAVIWSKPETDITTEILEKLNQREAEPKEQTEDK